MLVVECALRVRGHRAHYVGPCAKMRSIAGLFCIPAFLLSFSSAALAAGFIPSSRATAITAKSSSIVQPPIDIMPSIQSRGGGVGRGAKGAASESAMSDGEKSEKIANDALKSIQFCYKTCFAAVLADVMVTIIDADIWAKSMFGKSPETLTWIDFADLLDSLNLLVFGYGLMRVSKLYFQTLQDKSKTMTDDAVLDLMTTMARIWRSCSLSLAAVSLSMAASLREHAGGLAISAGTLPTIMFSILVVGSISVRSYCARSAAKEDRIDDDKAGSSKDTDTFELAREMGFRAYRNQALSAGAFAALASMALATWVVKPTDIVGRVFSVTDFIKPFAITGLLISLNKSFLRAVIAATRSGAYRGKIDDDIYDDLFVAQTGFYTKVGETLKSAAIFRLLPYFVAPFLPYILEAARSVAPALVDKVVGAG